MSRPGREPLLEENDRWYRASGGGDGALLTRCLLAALSAGPDGEAAVSDLHAVLEEARRHHDLETQTLALDALARAAAARSDLQQAARLLQEADALDPDPLRRTSQPAKGAAVAKATARGPVSRRPAAAGRRRRRRRSPASAGPDR